MEATTLIAVAIVATLVAIGWAVVRVVPAGHRGVVTRAGRVTRSSPSGPAIVAPGVERIEMVALPWLEPFGVELVDVDLLDAEVRVGPELLRLLA